MLHLKKKEEWSEAFDLNIVFVMHELKPCAL